MIRSKTVENLKLSLLESWNDSNPKEKLDKDLIDLIDAHLNMAYTSGVDELSFKLLPVLDKKKNSQISKYYIRSLIMNFES